MKILIAALSVLFSGLEIAAQILLSPLTFLIVVGLFGFTALMGRQVRRGAWRTQSNWELDHGVRMAGAAL